MALHTPWGALDEHKENEKDEKVRKLLGRQSVCLGVVSSEYPPLSERKCTN